ncbi:ATPase [Streptomyces sp. NBC_01808]|uniref:ATPase n=1 Tax=Streptomyces sp. NBC_01808 TaxID=2975947 RepID=UPI002DD96E9D|nr:ATPase [Streptomyces sp. NBC_01808]WSA39350.1 ATPase [Streptomyces sp. NBC_01808]
MITADPPVAVRLLSFGYAHGRPVPDAHIVLDLRAHFGDSPESRDPDRLVSETDGLPELVEGVIPVLAAYRSGSGSCDGPVVVGVGCADGRLAAAVAATMQRQMDNGLVLVTVEHRHEGVPCGP